MIGIPLCANDCTSRIKRISYARVRVEVDVTQEIRTKIQIENVDGRVMNQKVVYEWLPWFCPKCDVVGHCCEVAPKMQWVPKAVEPTKVTPTTTPSQIQNPQNSHEAGWIAATKVARSNVRLQRSLGVQKSHFDPLDSTQKRNVFQEGLHIVTTQPPGVRPSRGHRGPSRSRNNAGTVLLHYYKTVFNLTIYKHPFYFRVK